MAALDPRALLARHKNVAFFIGGFLFDLATLSRIDAWLDLALQGLYLGAVTALVLLESRRELGLWAPSGLLARLWRHQLQALHFFYGGLLSAYVVFYSKSAGGGSSLIFLALIAALMVANEMPQVQEAGSRMRLGLHAFCLASYLNYLLPVLAGRMGALYFAAALALTVAAAAAMVRALSAWSASPPWRLGWAPAAVLAALALFYWMRWIPPVPLSLKYAGVYHRVERDGEGFRLTYRKPPWYLPWREDDRRFLARPGEAVYCFVMIFAPTRFQHEIRLRWQWKDPVGGFATTDLIPLPIQGGRGQGYRGFAAKTRWKPGRWKVAVETEDGRVIGETAFSLAEDAGAAAPVWRQRRM